MEEPDRVDTVSVSEEVVVSETQTYGKGIFENRKKFFETQKLKLKSSGSSVRWIDCNKYVVSWMFTLLLPNKFPPKKEIQHFPCIYSSPVSFDLFPYKQWILPHSLRCRSASKELRSPQASKQEVIYAGNCFASFPPSLISHTTPYDIGMKKPYPYRTNFIELREEIVVISSECTKSQIKIIYCK